MNNTRKYFLIIIFSFLHAQDIDLYLSLIREGNFKGVKENLPELTSKYPKNAGVLYLKALLTEDGHSAIKQYENIFKNYPKSQYAPLSAMKIGEYFYAKGLYTQSGNLLKNIPANYPRFKDMQRLTNLMINSFNSIGEADSAKYYGLIILSKKKYNILVSGASGFIGLMLIKELLKQGHSVYGIVRKNINMVEDIDNDT